jgi:hypothetical protein
VPGLRALERGIRYPIADGADWFSIDHGPDYHPFFSGLGDAHWFIALDGEAVVGSWGLVIRDVYVGGRPFRSLYSCDLKVAKSHRGRDLTRKIAMGGLRDAVFEFGWPLRPAWGVAMRGARGRDVTSTLKGLHPARLSMVFARFAVFFEKPEKLASLALEDVPRAPRGPMLNLSATANGVVSTAGKKDFRLESTGKPWQLQHIVVRPSDPSWASRIKELAATLRPGTLACFAVDERLEGHLRWLDRAGLTPGATATAYGFVLNPLFLRYSYVHLATSEI